MSDFVFSIDVEMGVGIEHFTRKVRPDPENERKAVPKIISLCKDYGIKPTFALCGHLFLDKCNGHKKMSGSYPSYYSGDWYKNDPKSSFPKNKSWYAPDIVDLIKKSGFELASHSFSHPPFNECSKKVAEAEISESVKIASKKKVSLKTFVFPRNEVAYLELLPRYGFTHYVSFPETENILISASKRSLNFHKPKKHASLNLIEVPRTFFFYRTPKRDLLKLKALLLVAKGKGSMFHLWSHAFNIHTDEQIAFLEKIFKMAIKSGFESKFVSEIKPY